MDSVKWTEIAALITAVVALGFSPWIGWLFTRRSQKDDARRQVKINVFGALMENRYSTESPEAIRALNLIDVAFHENRSIRKLWREYFEMISKPAFFKDDIGFELRDQKLQDLLTEMARDLDFGIDRFDVARIYTPRWMVEEESLRVKERQARISALLQGPQTNLSRQSIPDHNVQTSRSALLPPVVGTDSSAPTGPPPAIYLVRYVGANASGVATLLVGNGIISGSDIVGGRYEGSYKVTEDRLEGTVTMHVQSGTTLVTGAVVSTQTALPITLNLPSTFADGQHHTIDIAGKPVQVTFEKIQDL